MKLSEQPTPLRSFMDTLSGAIHGEACIVCGAANHQPERLCANCMSLATKDGHSVIFDYDSLVRRRQ